MIVVTFWILRRFIGDFFQIFHAALALATLGGTLWHVYSLFSVLAKVLASICSATWVLTTISRIILTALRGRHIRVRKITIYQDITVIDIIAKYNFQAFPGAYFYVTFPGSFWSYELWRSYPMKAFWKEYPSEAQQAQPLPQKFSLIISNREQGSQHISKLEHRRYILLEGPYGQALPVQEYENVILVAEGAGLLGILPLASYLASRRLYDDATRSLLQDIPLKEAWVERAEKEWKAKEKELVTDEQELIWKQQQVRNNPRTQRKLSNMLETESKSLRKERLAMDREEEGIRQRKEEIKQQKGKIFNASPFNDSARRVDIFWLLESNDQMVWAKKYLQYLQKLDPDHVSFPI